MKGRSLGIYEAPEKKRKIDRGEHYDVHFMGWRVSVRDLEGNRTRLEDYKLFWLTLVGRFLGRLQYRLIA